jgi:hypothetical protein
MSTSTVPPVNCERSVASLESAPLSALSAHVQGILRVDALSRIIAL